MMKKLVFILLLLLFVQEARAQQVVLPCTQQTQGGVITSCAPVSAINPLPVTTSGSSSIVPIKSAAAETAHVFKASSGTLYGFSVTNGASAGYVLVINAAADPGNGAVTPSACYQLPANSTVGVSYNGAPLTMNTGITAVFSTTGCFTETQSSTAFFSGQVQ